MNIFFFIFISIVSANVYVEKVFSNWSKKHGKTYASNSEAIKRYNIFQSNLEWITKRNAELKHMQVGLNQFADLTQKEFIAMYLHPINETAYSDKLKNAGASVWEGPIRNITAGVNGKCQTPVRNQASCGSCWAFSATGVIESAMCIPGADKNSFEWVSPQEFVDCTQGGCNGGWAPDALAWSTKHNVCLESRYPYKATRGVCQMSKCKVCSEVLTLAYAHEYDGGLERALQQSFVSIGIDANGLDFRFYKSGTFHPSVNCGYHGINHAVMAVSLQGGRSGTYRVKNSWGPNWGREGYFTMPAGVNCLGIDSVTSGYVYKSQE